MGASCCNGDKINQEEIVRKESKFLTHEDLAETLSKIEPKKGKAIIDMNMLETILLEDTEENDHDNAPEEIKRKIRDRKATGFVTAKNVESAQDKLSFDVPDVDKVPAAEADRIKARKGTGFVTKEKLLAVLNTIDTDEDEEEEKEQVAELKPVVAKPKSRCSARKGTGFVTKKKLKAVIDTLGEDMDMP